MIANVNVRTYRPAQSQSLVRGVSKGRSLSMPALAFSKPLGLALAVAGLVLVSMSFVLGGQVSRMEAQITQLSNQQVQLKEASARLLAQQERLSSDAYIQIVAAEKLQLFAPEKGQVHRM